MANEGEFPKVDGDILYASEVNTFANSPNMYSQTFNTVVSGTDWQTLGSLVIPAGSLTYPTVAHIQGCATAGNTTGIRNIKVIFSGTDFENDFFVSGVANGYNKFYSIDGVLGSQGVFQFQQIPNSTFQGGCFPNANTGNNSLPNSGLVIVYEVISNTAGTGNQLNLFTNFQNIPV